MAKFRIRKNWKSLLSGILVAALLIGAVVGLAAVFNKKTRTINSLTFSVGAIGAGGEFVKSNQSVVSDYFECDGLTVDPADNATGTYRVFYYSADKVYVDSTTEMDALSGVYKRGDTISVAKYARVVITPTAPADHEGDFKIRFYEAAKYANDFTVTVSKKQSYVNLYNDDNATYGKTFDFIGYDEFLTIVDDVETKCSEKIKVSGKYSAYDVWVQCDKPVQSACNVMIGSEKDDKSLAHASLLSSNFIDGWQKITVEVPAGATDGMFLIVRADKDANICIIPVK